MLVLLVLVLVLLRRRHKPLDLPPSVPRKVLYGPLTTPRGSSSKPHPSHQGVEGEYNSITLLPVSHAVPRDVFAVPQVHEGYEVPVPGSGNYAYGSQGPPGFGDYALAMPAGGIYTLPPEEGDGVYAVPGSVGGYEVPLVGGGNAYQDPGVVYQLVSAPPSEEQLGYQLASVQQPSSYRQVTFVPGTAEPGPHYEYASSGGAAPRYEFDSSVAEGSGDYVHAMRGDGASRQRVSGYAGNGVFETSLGAWGDSNAD